MEYASLIVKRFVLASRCYLYFEIRTTIISRAPTTAEWYVYLQETSLVVVT
jgi:hypothetical protein